MSDAKRRRADVPNGSAAVERTPVVILVTTGATREAILHAVELCWQAIVQMQSPTLVVSTPAANMKPLIPDARERTHDEINLILNNEFNRVAADCGMLMSFAPVAKTVFSDKGVMVSFRAIDTPAFGEIQFEALDAVARVVGRDNVHAPQMAIDTFCVDGEARFSASKTHSFLEALPEGKCRKAADDHIASIKAFCAELQDEKTYAATVTELRRQYCESTVQISARDLWNLYLVTKGVQASNNCRVSFNFNDDSFVERMFGPVNWAKFTDDEKKACLDVARSKAANKIKVSFSKFFDAFKYKGCAADIANLAVMLACDDDKAALADAVGVVDYKARDKPWLFSDAERKALKEQDMAGVVRNILKALTSDKPWNLPSIYAVTDGEVDDRGMIALLRTRKDVLLTASVCVDVTSLTQDELRVAVSEKENLLHDPQAVSTDSIKRETRDLLRALSAAQD